MPLTHRQVAVVVVVYFQPTFQVSLELLTVQDRSKPGEEPSFVCKQLRTFCTFGCKLKSVEQKFVLLLKLIYESIFIINDSERFVKGTLGTLLGTET